MGVTTMKSIYILLTRSTTICSRIVYMATRSEFTHAAISLDRNFDKLYTFGRKLQKAGFHDLGADEGHLLQLSGFLRGV